VTVNVDILMFQQDPRWINYLYLHIQN